ncbi:hypothetical protein ABIB57_005390 [Devosia sp. UYZn731]
MITHWVATRDGNAYRYLFVVMLVALTASLSVLLAATALRP